MKTVSVYLNREYLVKLETVKALLGLKTDSEALRKAIEIAYDVITKTRARMG